MATVAAGADGTVSRVRGCADAPARAAPRVDLAGAGTTESVVPLCGTPTAAAARGDPAAVRRQIAESSVAFLDNGRSERVPPSDCFQNAEHFPNSDWRFLSSCFRPARNSLT